MGSIYTSSKKQATGDKTTITLTTTSNIPASTSITITLYEDVGQTGTFNNSASVTLTGGTDETNDLTGFDGGGSTNDYWFDAQIDGDGATPTLDSPTLTSADINVTTSTGSSFSQAVDQAVAQTEDIPFSITNPRKEVIGSSDSTSQMLILAKILPSTIGVVDGVVKNTSTPLSNQVLSETQVQKSVSTPLSNQISPEDSIQKVVSTIENTIFGTSSSVSATTELSQAMDQVVGIAENTIFQPKIAKESIIGTVDDRSNTIQTQMEKVIDGSDTLSTPITSVKSQTMAVSDERKNKITKTLNEIANPKDFIARSLDIISRTITETMGVGSNRAWDDAWGSEWGGFRSPILNTTKNLGNPITAVEEVGKGSSKDISNIFTPIDSVSASASASLQMVGEEIIAISEATTKRFSEVLVEAISPDEGSETYKTLFEALSEIVSLDEGVSSRSVFGTIMSSTLGVSTSHSQRVSRVLSSISGAVDSVFAGSPFPDLEQIIDLVGVFDKTNSFTGVFDKATSKAGQFVKTNSLSGTFDKVEEGIKGAFDKVESLIGKIQR